MSKRIPIAFAGAPLVSAILYALWGQISSRLSLPGEFWVTLLVAYICGLYGTVLVALPVFLAARRFRLVRWWSALITGAVLGLLFSSLGSTGDTAWRVAVTCIGAASSVVFWLVIRPEAT